MSQKFAPFELPETLNLRCLFTIAVLIIVGGSVARAQTNDEVNASIQFNFSNPGARSLALGGAFIGMADDATAAYANPAGLKVLSKTEVSIEGRRWNYTHVFTDSGNAEADGLEGLMNGRAENEVAGLSFLSFVYPGKRWAVALYRHELANFEASFNEAFGDEPLVLEGGSTLYPVRTALDLAIVNLGLSASVSLTEKLSLGVGVTLLDFEIDSLTQRFPDNTGATPPVSQQAQAGDDTEFSWNAGFLWDINEHISFGGVFRSGASFDLIATTGDAVIDAAFNVPDSYGVGLAIRPLDRLTLTLDYVRVEYSDMVSDFTDLFGTTDIDQYKLDDGNEFHFGVEYVFLPGGQPLAIRVGTWRDPDHSIRYEGIDVADRALFRGGSDDTHYSMGLGRSFGKHFQIDAAVDLADRIDTTSLSAILRF